MTTMAAEAGAHSPIRVGILEDQRVMRESLAEVLAVSGFEVVLAAANHEDFLAAVHQVVPDVALVDLHLREREGQEPGGWHTVQVLREWYPELRILVLSASRDPGAAERSIREGAHGYLDKNEVGCEAVIGAIRAVRSGERLFPVSVALSGSAFSRLAEPDALRPLTTREREVLRYVAAAADNLKIAAMLGITERTVRAHVSSLYRKLGSENRSQLVLLARRLGIIPAPDV